MAINYVQNGELAATLIGQDFMKMCEKCTWRMIQARIVRCIPVKPTLLTPEDLRLQPAMIAELETD